MKFLALGYTVSWGLPVEGAVGSPEQRPVDLSACICAD